MLLLCLAQYSGGIPDLNLICFVLLFSGCLLLLLSLLLFLLLLYIHKLSLLSYTGAPQELRIRLASCISLAMMVTRLA